MPGASGRVQLAMVASWKEGCKMYHLINCLTKEKIASA
jgi:hypothetical protein